MAAHPVSATTPVWLIMAATTNKPCFALEIREIKLFLFMSFRPGRFRGDLYPTARTSLDVRVIFLRGRAIPPGANRRTCLRLFNIYGRRRWLDRLDDDGGWRSVEHRHGHHHDRWRNPYHDPDARMRLRTAAQACGDSRQKMYNYPHSHISFPIQ